MREELAMEGLNATTAWKRLVDTYTSSTKVTTIPNSFREAQALLNNASEILQSMNDEGKKHFKKWDNFGKELLNEVTRLEKLDKKC